LECGDTSPLSEAAIRRAGPIAHRPQASKKRRPAGVLQAEGWKGAEVLK